MTSVVSQPLREQPIGQQVGPVRSWRIRERGTPRTPWPYYGMIAAFPIWWAIGLGPVVFPLLAVPLAWQLAKLRPLRLPPGWIIWVCFLGWVLLSGTMLGMHPPDTLAGSPTARLLPFTSRYLSYLSATVVLLYVYNAPDRLLSIARTVSVQALLFVEVIGLGVLGVLFPRFTFTAPLAHIVPAGMSGQNYLVQRTQLSFAQLQSVLGYPAPRPAAPFAYTNAWGEISSLLAVWFIVWGWSRRERWGKPVTLAVLLVAAVPTVYSLNRGMWAGVAVALVYIGLRRALHGHLLQALIGAVAVALVALGVLASPLGATIQERFAHPHSNEARASVSAAAIKGAMTSPVLGYGSTRDVVGSNQSITVGRSASCLKCGNAAIGGAGHLWLLIFSQGFVGAGLYVLFFLRCLWVSRRSRAMVALAGSTVMIMGLLYMFVYGHVGMPLLLYMTAAALMARASQSPPPVPAPTRRRSVSR
ncbi:O-antigen ligase family protein [Angustibacter sp. McL0619]|uniref:O-antigen ligase family protein n=1 Tax=Angustibacter sp. McL0619 TaxID=3415676 RepID=UPI003CEFE20A